MEVGDLLTVLGDLIDNAIDAAVLGQRRAPWVEVEFAALGADLRARERPARALPGPTAMRFSSTAGRTKGSKVGCPARSRARRSCDRSSSVAGGFVEVSQQEGAVFSVLLPGCVRGDGGGRAAMIRTLVVDDDFRVASIHAAYVEKVPGFSVVGQVHSAESLVTSIGPLQPDLILLDLYLPDHHGLEVLKRLRQAWERS